MKICTKCGRPLTEGASFCVYCGQTAIPGYGTRQQPKKKKWIPLVIIFGSITLTIGIIVLVLCLAIDWHPVSQEEIMRYQEEITADVYWTTGGKIFHTHEDCPHLANQAKLHEGSVTEAIKAGKARICKTCANRDGIETAQ